MRIYTNMFEAVKETAREVFEMGVRVPVQTVQDKHVADDPDYDTLELQEYAFQITDPKKNEEEERQVIEYCLYGKVKDREQPGVDGVWQYVEQEFLDRITGLPSNPGSSWQYRKDVWEQFLHGGKFAYTYSERLSPQWFGFFHELRERPSTRQAILTLHTNICPQAMPVRGDTRVDQSADIHNMGGSGRIPCSLYYQAIRRNNKLHWIYAMRSCDFIVHFAVDIILAMRLQRWAAEKLGIEVGPFTYFTGSLHAYAKDMKVRGIF